MSHICNFEDDLKRLEKRVDEIERIGMTEEHKALFIAAVTEAVTNQFYQSVGRSIVSKFLWVTGVIGVALMMWLAANGKLTIKASP